MASHVAHWLFRALRLLAHLCRPMLHVADYGSVVAELEADAVLLIFTLAALDPSGQAAMLQNAFKVGCSPFYLGYQYAHRVKHQPKMLCLLVCIPAASWVTATHRAQQLQQPSPGHVTCAGIETWGPPPSSRPWALRHNTCQVPLAADVSEGCPRAGHAALLLPYLGCI